MKNSPAYRSCVSSAIFLLVLLASLMGIASVFSPATAALRAAAPAGTINPNYALISEICIAIAVFISLRIMCKHDHAPLSWLTYSQRPRLKPLLFGLLSGFAALALIVGIQHAMGVLDITRSSTGAPFEIHCCLSWSLCFLLTGFCEECVFRGYLLRTLNSGLGFWPAAIITSLMFAGAHISNHGEQPLGLLACVLYSLFFALTVRALGSIWFAVGFHATWDWSQTYLFGTPDSGILGNGHLFLSVPRNSSLLSGGSTGPEGSIVALLFVLFLIAALQFWYIKNYGIRAKSKQQASVRLRQLLREI
jgi:uncharacterized protein